VVGELPSIAAATADNAHWCDTVCRTHAIDATFAADAWTAAARTPPLYSDAVTLAPGCDAEALLARIDSGPGSSVKDSFCDLDLSAHGYAVLFHGTWVGRPAGAGPAAAPELDWRRVASTDDFAAWEEAWFASEAEPGPRPLLPALLDVPTVTILAGLDAGRVRAGAVVTTSAGVAGVSNWFAPEGLDEEPWRGVISLVGSMVPDIPLVGWDGGTMDAPIAIEIVRLGPLRVWLRDEQPAAN
jgi:hypothetical protein